MGYIQSAYLIALVTLVVPIVLHLFSRWQSQRIELGTMRFLREILTENAHRRRIRRWLLLLTRMSMLGLLAILFARPFFSIVENRDGDRRRIILIDRSASMLMRSDQGRLIEHAIDQANKLSKELGADAKIDFAFFDTRVYPFVPREGRVVLAEATTNQIAGATDYTSAIAWARDLIAKDSKSKTDVFLISDMQRRGMADLQEVQFPREVPFKVVDVGRAAATNLSIISAEAFGVDKKATSKEAVEKPRSESASNPSIAKLNEAIRPEQSVHVHVTFFNFGPLLRQDLPVLVTATRAGKTAKVRSTLNIPSEQAAELELDLGKLDSGMWEIAVSVDVDDDLQVDNRRLCAALVQPVPEILVIDDTEGDLNASDPTYFLMAALGAKPSAPKSRFNAQREFSNNALSKVIRTPMWPAIIVADVSKLGQPLLGQLERYVDQGGNLLAFAGRGCDTNDLSQWANSTLSPGLIRGVKTSGVVPFRLTEIMRQHPLMAPFEDPQNGDLERLAFRKVVSLDPSSKGQVLAWFERKLPALVEYRVGNGRTLWFMSDAGDAWSSWAKSPLYLPIIQQMTGDLLGMTGEGLLRTRNVGDPKSILVGQSPTGNDGTKLTQISFNASRDENSDNADGVFSKSGFYQEQGALYVVNTPERESDTARVEEIDFRRSIGLDELVGNTEAVESQTQIKRGELWPWFASLLLIVLVFEYVLSNRTPP